jgi:hypothetical protein
MAMVEPNLLTPNTDKELPSRAKLLTDIWLPIMPKSIQERLSIRVNVLNPKTEIELPKTAKLRNESELPRWSQSKTETPFAKRVTACKLTDSPIFE